MCSDVAVGISGGEFFCHSEVTEGLQRGVYEKMGAENGLSPLHFVFY